MLTGDPVLLQATLVIILTPAFPGLLLFVTLRKTEMIQVSLEQRHQQQHHLETLDWSVAMLRWRWATLCFAFQKRVISTNLYSSFWNMDCNSLTHTFTKIKIIDSY